MTTRNSVQQLLSGVTIDPWRTQVGFSADLAEANQRIFNATTDDEVAKHLNDWLQRNQPCLFGRLGAKCDQLSFCILRESDLQNGDAFIREKIQKCRTDWTREAFRGTRSGFIILAVSESLSLAVPDNAIAAIARRLAELYLLDEIAFDRIHLEEVFLEQPGREAATWRWDAGINYFASHGDKRWWHDHRIPGGIGFSTNSVGHMAKSGLMRNALAKLEEVLETSDAAEARAKIDSLSKALELAMTTIDRAADTVSGKATTLLPLSPDTTLPAQLPSLPTFLAGKNPCEYFGYYHTDFTLPNEYFIADVERPAHIRGHSLDFTYLFDSSIDNPAFVTMGKGRRVREWDDPEVRGDESPAISSRLAKAVPQSIPISEASRLKAILG